MTKPANVIQCAELIKKAKNIVALTGAGISTSCGIPDFRGPEGLYVTKRYDADTIFDIDYFHRDPKPFFDFARDFISLEEKILPSFTHQFFAKLEQSGKCKAIITQNIDSLHQKAGSQNVLEFHGSFLRSHCLSCGKKYDYSTMRKLISTFSVPRCVDGGVIKPDVVFFGENVLFQADAAKLAEESDLFFVIGTSCVVHPAGSIPLYAGGDIIIVNLTPVKLPITNIALEVNSDIDQFFQEVAKLIK